MKLGELDFRELKRRLRHGTFALEVGPFIYRIQSPLLDVAEAMQFGYDEFLVVDEGRFSDFHLRLLPATGLHRWWHPQVRVLLDGLSTGSQPRLATVPIMEWSMNWCVAIFSHRYLVIHAAVLERDGHAVIISGTSGAGKSTLSAALALRGWRLLSDELTLVRPEDGRLVPFPKPVSLKNESIDVIRQFSTDAAIGPSWQSDLKGTIAYMRPPDESIRLAQKTVLPSWVIYLTYQPGVEPHSERQPRGTALMRLAHNSVNYSMLQSRGFQTMAQLIDQSDCFKFRYGDLEEAVELFERLPEPRCPTHINDR